MKIINDRFRNIFGGLLLSSAFLALTAGYTAAQEKISGEISKSYQVILNDGSTVTGKLLLINDSEIVIESGSMGEVHLKRENIRSMMLVSAIDDKKSGIWFPNPNPSKYLLGNSAIPNKKNSGYYQNTWIFFNTFSYAFTGNLSVSAGFELFSVMASGEGPYAFFINPKASFKVANNFYAGANILYANTIKTVDEFGGLATLNGFCTYGNNNNNITGSVGWGWAEGEFSARPVFTVSGMTRVSKRIAFISENWLVPGLNFNDDENSNDSGNYYGIFSYGIRFLGEKTSIDLAFVNNPDIAEEIIIGIPWLDFVINF
ncbi:MAG: hypothetical protein RBR81_03955 [Bacteroidales bacterium]|jgi:hypothetical protein|nr:hypothetical protein [Bacteroidales bacterium]